jgi:hypothetical protein
MSAIHPQIKTLEGNYLEDYIAGGRALRLTVLAAGVHDVDETDAHGRSRPNNK